MELSFKIACFQALFYGVCADGNDADSKGGSLDGIDHRHRGGVHPILHTEDLERLNPWAGAQGIHDVESKPDSNRMDSEEERSLRLKAKRPPPQQGPDKIYDAIIVGAGPGGCAAAYTLVEEGIDPADILVLERGPSLDAYKAKGYDDVLAFRASQSDPLFREGIPNTPIVLGVGVGGGTNHFGMQFIDQAEVSDASARQPVPGSDIAEEVTAFSQLSGASTYSDADYEYHGVSEPYADLYAKIDEVLSGNGMSYRNNIYKLANGVGGGTIDSPKRLLPGDLIDAGTEVRSETEVISLQPGRFTDYHCVTLDDGSSECARHILLAANPLNSARLALNAGVIPHDGRDKGKKYLAGLWDHVGIVYYYYPPGTEWVNVTVPPIGDAQNPANLPVYPTRDDAIVDNPDSGFIAHITTTTLTSAQIAAIQDGTFVGADPIPSGADDRLTYIVDLGGFFSTNGQHPGGNKEGVIAANDFDLGVTLTSNAAESHNDGAMLARIVRAGGEIIGILDNAGSTKLEVSFTNIDASALVNALKVLPHAQGRPDHHLWQFYHTPVPFLDYQGILGELLISVLVTGEQIQDDGRVYQGASVTEDTVKLPSFTQDEFNVLKEGSELMDQALTELGWLGNLGGRQYIPDTKEFMEAFPTFLPSTYHYHGMMCPLTDPLADGFHSCDLARMCRKWAGSTSAAAGGMGVQCARVVAQELNNP